MSIHEVAEVEVLTAHFVQRVEERLVTLLQSPEVGMPGGTHIYGHRLRSDILRLALAGGKRIRPRLAYLGFMAADAPHESVSVVDLGVALEVFHCSAMILDDIIDESETRRGLPSSHRWWGEEHRRAGMLGSPVQFGTSAALLAGYLALAMADAQMDSQPESVRLLWARMKCHTIVGEFAELEASARDLDDRPLIGGIARLKTASYSVVSPLSMGAALGGAPELTSTFEEYGLAVGEAFQIRDDLIDVLGSAEEAGKPVGQDAARSRSTALYAILTDLDPSLKAGPVTDDRHAQVSERVRDPEVLNEVEACIDALLSQAFDALDRSDIGDPWRQSLKSLAVQLAYRRT